MRGFDNEIEKAVNRAGKAAGWLFALGVLTLILGGISEPNGWVLAVPGAGLLFGLGVIINLLGMHLMETWRQGKLPQANTTED